MFRIAKLKILSISLLVSFMTTFVFGPIGYAGSLKIGTPSVIKQRIEELKEKKEQKEEQEQMKVQRGTTGSNGEVAFFDPVASKNVTVKVIDGNTQDPVEGMNAAYLNTGANQICAVADPEDRYYPYVAISPVTTSETPGAPQERVIFTAIIITVAAVTIGKALYDLYKDPPEVSLLYNDQGLLCGLRICPDIDDLLAVLSIVTSFIGIGGAVCTIQAAASATGKQAAFSIAKGATQAGILAGIANYIDFDKNDYEINIFWPRTLEQLILPAIIIKKRSATNSAPTTPGIAPTGPAAGQSGVSYEFTVCTTDPEADWISYRLDWGDGTSSDWSPLCQSGVDYTASHSWTNKGTYSVKAQAKDSHGRGPSGWSPSAEIKIGGDGDKPDLIVYSIDGPHQAGEGDTISVSNTIKNQGIVSAGEFYVHFYLSLNTSYEDSDTKIGSRHIPSLGAGQTSPDDTSVNLPAGVKGNYHIIGFADATDPGLVDEQNENNNTNYYSITIGENHNPVIESLTANPGQVTPGENSTITCVASDQDEDSLTYSWEKEGGTISGSGSQVIWAAPDTLDTYTITVIVSDGKGGTANKSVDIIVKEENHPPVIQSLTADPQKVKTGETSIVTCVASDPDGDPLTYSWDSPGGGSFSGSVSTSTVTWVAPEPGYYTVTVTVNDGQYTDQKGVEIEVPGTFEVNIVINNGAEYTQSGKVMLGLYCSTSSVVMRFKNENLNWSDWIPYPYGTNSYSWDLSAGDGQKTVYGEFKKDIITMPDSASIFKDTQRPTTPSITGPSGWQTTSPQSFSWDADDPGGTDASGIKGYYYALDDSTPNNWTASTSKQFSDEGWHTLYVQAEDNAGWKSSDCGTREFGIDTRDPNPPSLYSPNDGQILSNYSVTFDWSSASDPSPGSGRKCYELWIDDNSSFSSPLKYYPTSSQYTKTLIHGTWYWKVRTIDNVERKSSWAPSRSVILNKAPYFTNRLPADGSKIYPPSNAWHTVNFSWSATDPDGDSLHYWFIIYGGNWEDRGSNTSYDKSLYTGYSHNWGVKVSDGYQEVTASPAYQVKLYCRAYYWDFEGTFDWTVGDWDPDAGEECWGKSDATGSGCPEGTQYHSYRNAAAAAATCSWDYDKYMNSYMYYGPINFVGGNPAREVIVKFWYWQDMYGPTWPCFHFYVKSSVPTQSAKGTQKFYNCNDANWTQIETDPTDELAGKSSAYIHFYFWSGGTTGNSHRGTLVDDVAIYIMHKY